MVDDSNTSPPDEEGDDDAQQLEPGTHSPGDSVFDAFPPEIDLWGRGEDGLPSPIEKDTGDGPHPFTPENLVCMRQATADICQYYKRQLTPLGPFRDQRNVDRWCLHPGMRALNGAALNLSESAMFACELREPPHPESAKLLDEGDEKRLRLSSDKDKKYWRIFRTPDEAAKGVSELSDTDYEDKPTGL